MTWDDDLYTCKYCGRDDLVLASGPKRASILIIAEEPGKDEVKRGKPMVGAMGEVLRQELGRADLDMNQMRLTNLWLHPQQKVGAKDTEGLKIKEQCFKHGLNEAIKEARNRKAILLIGSDTVKFFCDEKVSEVNGLEVQSVHLSAPLLFACVQPATVWHKSLGEVRLSLQKFGQRINKL
jgi:uracil-DNA glycosylase family 4